MGKDAQTVQLLNMPSPHRAETLRCKAYGPPKYTSKLNRLMRLEIEQFLSVFPCLMAPCPFEQDTANLLVGAGPKFMPRL